MEYGNFAWFLDGEIFRGRAVFRGFLENSTKTVWKMASCGWSLTGGSGEVSVFHNMVESNLL